MEELSALKTKLNDKVEMTMDMHSLKAEIPPCNLILTIHVLYYATDLRKVLTDVHALLKADGECLWYTVLASSPGSPADCFNTHTCQKRSGSPGMKLV